MGRWKLEYYDGGVEDWVEFAGRLEEIVEELSGHEEVSFVIPNTVDNRTFVASDQLIRILFDETQVYLGVLYDVVYSKKQLKCFVYNGVYELLKRRVISQNCHWWPAHAIAEWIRQAAGLTNPVEDCPTTNLDMFFDQTICFDAVEQLADALNKDYWVTGGDTLHISVRGSGQSFDGNISDSSERTASRSKKRNKVHIRGFTRDGEQIMGYAGEGDDVTVYWNNFATTEETLNYFAEKKLAEVNQDDSSVALTCPITSGVNLHPGDTITINKPELGLDGSYRIVKITKHRKTVDIEVTRKKKTTEDVLAELSQNNGQAVSFSSTAMEVIETMNLKPALVSGAAVKSAHNLVTTYMKNSCILPTGVAVASPTGNMNSYEGGYIALALIEKNGAGERDLARDILDEFAEVQNADGSWYQQYNPYLNVAGLHDRVDSVGGGYSGDLKVDSGSALLAWAMSRYDEVTSGTRYQTEVRKALQFLRELQYAHQVAHSTSLISNLVYQGSTDTVALAADCAECLMSMKAAMDAYGDSLTTDPGGYSVKTMANDLYYSLCVYSWTGDSGRYYATSYPIGEETEIPFTYKEKISYTQALCSWANYVFANSGYLTCTDYSSQAEKALDFINTITAGQWGGQHYCPYVGAADETQEEFAGYTALMTISMNAVNSSKYAVMITKGVGLLRWMALEDGRIYDIVKPNGELLVSRVSPSEEGYGFLSLPIALGLLAGA